MIQSVLSDILTDFNCSALVTELTKFILFRKQQIPITYDKLNYILKRKNATQPERQKSGRLNQSEKLFKKAEAGIETLNDIFFRTAEVFTASPPGETITEVALLFGGSILTPKQIYRIRLPSIEIGHSREYHSERRIMSEVLHVLLSCDQLHDVLSKPLEPTNMFLLIRKSGTPHSETWLLPKPGYNIPTFGQHFFFKFDGMSPEEVTCSCKGFNVFSDSDIDIEIRADLPRTAKEQKDDEVWFQAPQVFKGFKDVYVNGVSVSKEWYYPEDRSNI